MKTIKLIDLFIKIANGEKTPEKIKFNYKIFTHDGDIGNDYYICKENGNLLEESFIFENLNEEVEIIEDVPKENKKIEKLELETAIMNSNGCAMYYKLNEIIDRINGE